LVATIRSLRHHGGATKEQYNDASVERVSNGFANLEKHIENCKKFGLNPVVAINAFPTDSAEEVKLIQDRCADLGVKAIVAEGFAKGGDGMTNLAQAVVTEIESGKNNFKPLYDWKLPIKEKIEIIAKNIYGADGVEYSKKAITDLKKLDSLGMSEFPICMAKTQKSFSDNESLIGIPTGFTINVREFEFASGAGFVIPILGNMMRMPGLPVIPASEGMFIDNDGKISGLS